MKFEISPSFRFGIIFLCLCLLFFFIIPSPSADAAVAEVAAIVIASLAAGLTASGISTAINGSPEFPGVDWSVSQYKQMLSDLVTEFCISLGRNVESVFPVAEIAIASSGVITLGSTFSKSFQQFLNWLQTSKGLVSNGPPVNLGMVTVSGGFNITDLIPFYAGSPTSKDDVLLLTEMSEGVGWSGVWYNTNIDLHTLPSSIPFYVFAVPQGENNIDGYNLYFACSINWYTSGYRIAIRSRSPGAGYGSTQIGYNPTIVQDSYSNLYYVASPYNNNWVADVTYAPIYSSLSDGLNAISVGDLDVDLVFSPGVISIPQTEEGESTSIYVPGLTVTDFPSVSDHILSESLVGDLEASYTDTPVESQVSIPEISIPTLFQFQIPNFVSLFGIWHYVVDWVHSLGSFAGTVFSIWSSLPYAMVLPVYASAVVVIVLGMYRRFFM